MLGFRENENSRKQTEHANCKPKQVSGKLHLEIHAWYPRGHVAPLLQLERPRMQNITKGWMQVTVKAGMSDRNSRQKLRLQPA